ncbi:MAG TPA: methyltransferase domain-containing protein [Steroidobacteraceae bacterium]|nr:methyltransferase domain-containing protein [Steroidobacteraceae bacterium]
MTDTFSNVYDDAERARAYADLEFPGTYYLGFRDLPALMRRHVRGTRALDFGCGTGRSTRFLRELAFEVVGVDISPIMLAEARARDPHGDYRQVADGSLAGLGTGTVDLILAAFTFDNIPTDEQKTAALRELRRLLAPGGRLVVVVSSADIYLHEWASFSTRDYPANRSARDGDRVRIVMLDVPDRRPVVDVLCGDAHYRELFEAAGLRVVEAVRPLATGAEPVQWVSETTISPWNTYVLGGA